MATKTYTCPSCGGSGEVWLDELDDYDRCDNCGGTGELTDQRVEEISKGDQGRADFYRGYYGQSAGDIAAALGVHRQTVQQWARRKDFPAALGRVGNARVWDIDQVRKWREETNLQPGRPKGS